MRARSECGKRVCRVLAQVEECKASVSVGLPVRIACREYMVLLPVTYSLAFLMGLSLERQRAFAQYPRLYPHTISDAFGTFAILYKSSKKVYYRATGKKGHP